MSLSDTILANTVGLVFRAGTGNVDKWTLQQQKDDAAAAIKKAMGPNADPRAVVAAQQQAQSQIDLVLKQNNAHPDQAQGIRTPLGVIGSAEFLANMQKLVYGAIAVGGVIGVIYFASQFRRLKR